MPFAMFFFSQPIVFGHLMVLILHFCWLAYKQAYLCQCCMLVSTWRRSYFKDFIYPGLQVPPADLHIFGLNMPLPYDELELTLPYLSIQDISVIHELCHESRRCVNRNGTIVLEASRRHFSVWENAQLDIREAGVPSFIACGVLDPCPLHRPLHVTYISHELMCLRHDA